MFPEKIRTYAAITAASAALVGGMALLPHKEAIGGVPGPVPCVTDELARDFPLLRSAPEGIVTFCTTGSASPADLLPNAGERP